MDQGRLCQIRLAVRKAYAAYVKKCLAHGEHLVMPQRDYPDLLVPLGFTPNDFVKNVVEASPMGTPVDIFNGHYFFQSAQVAEGTWETGPQQPFRRLLNVLRAPAGGWEHAGDRAVERGYGC